MFFTATRTLGCQTYLESQKDACTCSFGEKVKQAAKKVAKKAGEVADEVGRAVKGATAQVEQVGKGDAASGISTDQQQQQPAATQTENKKQARTPPAAAAQPSLASAQDGVRAEAVAAAQQPTIHNRDEL